MRMKYDMSNVLMQLIALTLLFVTLPVYASETLRVVSFLPRNHPLMIQPLDWIESVNEMLDGQVRLELVGGPEAIPLNHQVEAVSSAVVELTITTTSNYQDELPEVSAFTLSELDPSGERESGFHDYMVDIHERMNVRYIGRVNRSPFYLFLKEKPQNLNDLKGVKVRTGTLYNRFLRELGMVPITISSSETYTALERGVIDGFVWQPIGPRQYGWLDDVNYVLDLPFFDAGNIVVLMNLDTWNSLAEVSRERIIRATAAFEPRMIAYYERANRDERAKISELGVEWFRFSDRENHAFLQTAYDVEWASITRRAPEAALKLKQMVTQLPRMGPVSADEPINEDE